MLALANIEMEEEYLWVLRWTRHRRVQHVHSWRTKHLMLAIFDEPEVKSAFRQQHLSLSLSHTHTHKEQDSGGFMLDTSEMCVSFQEGQQSNIRSNWLSIHPLFSASPSASLLLPE